MGVDYADRYRVLRVGPDDVVLELSDIRGALAQVAMSLAGARVMAHELLVRVGGVDLRG